MKISKVPFILLMFIVVAVFVSYNIIHTPQLPFMAFLNWYPGTFSSLLKFSYFFTYSFIFGFYILALYYHLVKRNVVCILTLFLASFFMTQIAISDDIELKLARELGFFAQVAKKSCWFPESYECLKGKGVLDNNAPRVWGKKGLTDWAQDNMGPDY